MGMSSGDLTRIKRELGMVTGERGIDGVFYKIQSAWLRELIHENDALRKIVADYHCTRDQRLKVENEKLRALESALRRVNVFGHTDECNSYMGWGDNDACDCPSKDVKAALKALDEETA